MWLGEEVEKKSEPRRGNGIWEDSERRESMCMVKRSNIALQWPGHGVWRRPDMFEEPC